MLTFFCLISSRENFPVEIFGLVDNIARIIVVKLNAIKIIVGKIMAGSSLKLLANQANPNEIIIPLSEIRIFDLLSAIELKFI